MDLLRNILLILHFVGLASLLGGFLVQIKPIIAGKGAIVAAMFHGALTQLVTGLLLVGVIQVGALGHIDNTKIGIKLLVLIVITVLVIVNRKKPSVSSLVLWAIGALTLVNVVIAVLWK
ncbi:hypothetical protein E3O45_04165 [Cryobacterium sp. TMS1-20-1]|uniref:hypothetical protein n=1 Tax=unclassified Cryobacterium TaxID=2649013 RepID=UPI00106D927A|nr:MULTISPECIES: hypothetical protein [unclassified Cryobacterium]TFC79471.1 hypothetical protein E3O45_04165 [Cryobacterium sp. TMS1-20-1]TFD56167.1 hypothetical protein E3T43_09705 [Cryobacterium sp. Hh7]